MQDRIEESPGLSSLLLKGEWGWTVGLYMLVRLLVEKMGKGMGFFYFTYYCRPIFRQVDLGGR